MAKFIDAEVLEIRWRAGKGEKLREIAVNYEVTVQTISYIVRRHTWKHI
jgi:hypothetical protein